MEQNQIEPRPARIATIDIETRPILGMTWGMWETDVIHKVQDWSLLSFSVKWSDEKKTKTYGLPDFARYSKDKSDDHDLAAALWVIFDQADIIIGHNSVKFDIKKANTRFLIHGFGAPSPYQTVDTYQLAKQIGAFTSNKLNELGKDLKLGQKVSTGGFSLWLRCMSDQYDKKAWDLMKKYNAQDVVLTEQLWNRLKGWAKNHPAIGVYEGKKSSCKSCGGEKAHKRGFQVIGGHRYQRYMCQTVGCGAWRKGERIKE